jgi:chemotaxis protein MotB
VSGGGGGGDPFHEEEEHENHERYLVTYADMITLLMALFIILFAMGQQADQEQFDRFRGGLAEAFDNPLILGTGGLVAFPSQAAVPVGMPSDAPGPDGPTGHVAPEEADQLADELEALLGSEGLDALTDVHVEADGVVVTMDTDGLVFDSGSSAMLPAGDDIVRRLIRSFSLVTNGIAVQGHTDDVPMSGGTSNWELSANRAGAVLHRLIEGGIPADRLSMAGYADTRPVASNDTEEGRARNRRVDIVVVLDGPDPTSDLLSAIEPIGDPLTDHER